MVEGDLRFRERKKRTGGVDGHLGEIPVVFSNSVLAPRVRKAICSQWGFELLIA